MRRHIADKRVLRLIKAFLRGGILQGDRQARATITGKPQGGILSPILANITLSALDEHFSQKWEALGPSWTRAKRRCMGVPAVRLARYADDFVVLVHGTRQDTEALWTVIAKVRSLTRRNKLRTLADLLHAMNRVMRGWCQYFRHGVSAKTFSVSEPLIPST